MGPDIFHVMNKLHVHVGYSELMDVPEAEHYAVLSDLQLAYAEAGVRLTVVIRTPDWIPMKPLQHACSRV